MPAVCRKRRRFASVRSNIAFSCYGSFAVIFGCSGSVSNITDRRRPGREAVSGIQHTYAILKKLEEMGYPNLGFPTGLKMETGSLQRAFRAGSEYEGRFPRLQSLGEDRPWTATCVWSGCTA